MTIPKDHAESIAAALLHTSAGDVTEEHADKMCELCSNIAKYLDTLNDISLQYRLADGVIDAFTKANADLVQTIYDNRHNMRKDYETVMNHKEMFN